MSEYLGEWPFKRGPVFKIRPSDGYGEGSVPSAVERWYDFLENGGYLGNVDSGSILQRPVASTHSIGPKNGRCFPKLK